VVALILITGGAVRHILNRIDAADSWESYRWALPVSALALLSVIYVTAPQTRTVAAGPAVSDAEAFAIAQRHCVGCHARAPSNPAFNAPPKNVTLEGVPEMKRYAAMILQQTVQNRAMPLGNQTGMTEEERDKLGRWVQGLK
jgi:uncharacterized membrane protein